MICKKQHRYDLQFSDLSEDQGGDGRHRCAACAYDQGYADGLARNKRGLDFDSLPESQAGTIRHKSPYEAYEAGYLAGIKDSQ